MKFVKIILMFLIIICYRPIEGQAQITSDEALSEFVSAGIAYKEGRYDVAISRYEKILNGQRVSGPLFYNLGNSYYKKQNIGKAVLNYERAKAFIPRDSDLNFNNMYVQSKVDQHRNSDTTNFIDRAINDFIQYYTIDEMVVFLVSFVMLIGIVFLVSLYIRMPKTWSNGLIATLLIGFFIFGSGLIAKVNSEWNLAIVMTEAESYFEPRSDSTEHFKLSEGTKIRILKSDLNWVKIERVDGKTGWVDKDVLEKI